MPQLQPGMARIRVKDLCLRTFIGINEDEIKNKQDVVINARIQYSAEAAANSDEMDKALNYRTITKQIIALVENNRFALLEKLTADVLALASTEVDLNQEQTESMQKLLDALENLDDVQAVYTNANL